MDATVEAALAAKLLKLFPGTDAKFLAIPLGGAAFSREELDFLDEDADGTAEQLRQKMAARNQFARVLNDIPSDSVVYTSENRLLWDEYRHVLSSAQSARTVLTNAETRELEEAQAYLTEARAVDGEATTVYSPALREYYEYKTVCQELDRIYADERISAEAAESAEAQAAWRERREPELAALKATALHDWLVLGHKDVVETHQATVARLSGKAPAIRILQYARDLEACRDTDLLSGDPLGTYVTFFSPGDIFEAEATWPSLHITREEIQSLLADAPDQIRRWGGAGAVTLESLTAEYAEVVVMRPWFQPSLFDSSHWKLGTGDPPVSDGCIPRSGTIPSFITSMIVARKVTREWLAPKESGPARPGGARPPRTIDLRSTRPGHPAPPMVRDPRAGQRADERSRRIIRTRRQGTTTRRRAVVLPPRPVSTRPVPPRMQRLSEETALDGVTVLAYVCRRIPESPRPDPRLEWA